MVFRLLAGVVLAALGVATLIFLWTALYARGRWGGDTLIQMGMPIVLLTPIFALGLMAVGAGLILSVGRKKRH